MDRQVEPGTASRFSADVRGWPPVVESRKSLQTWLAMLGAGISAGGEEKQKHQLYQKQIAATVAALLGLQFKTNHRVAKAMPVERIEPVSEIVVAGKGE